MSSRVSLSCTSVACCAASGSRFSSAVRIALCRGSDSACVFGQLAAELDRLAQRQRQHVADVGQQVVVGGLGDAAVERQVGLQQFVGRARRFHAGVGLGDALQLLVAGHLRRQRRGGRLEHAAHGHQRLDELRRRLRLDQPVQHVGVEQVPLAARPHDRAGALARQHQALGDQHAHRLAQHRAADVVLREQRGLGRQPVARLELARDDAHAQVAHDARVHALALGLVPVVAMTARRALDMSCAGRRAQRRYHGRIQRPQRSTSGSSRRAVSIRPARASRVHRAGTGGAARRRRSRRPPSSAPWRPAGRPGGSR